MMSLIADSRSELLLLDEEPACDYDRELMVALYGKKELEEIKPLLKINPKKNSQSENLKRRSEYIGKKMKRIGMLYSLNLKVDEESLFNFEHEDGEKKDFLEVHQKLWNFYQRIKDDVSLEHVCRLISLSNEATNYGDKMFFYSLVMYLLINMSEPRRGHPCSVRLMAWFLCVRLVLSVIYFLDTYQHILLLSGGNLRRDGNQNVWVDLRKTISDLTLKYLGNLRCCYDNKQEYNNWRCADSDVIYLASRAQKCLQQRGLLEDAARIAYRLIQLVYYKPHEKIRSMIDARLSLIESHGSDMTRAHTLLLDLYHHAMMDKFSVSVDLLVKLASWDWFPKKMHWGTMLFFNRAIAQLGLCAFRLGLIAESNSFLYELLAGGRVKELLIPLESPRRSQVCNHMHTDVELLHAVCLICVMLLEFPKICDGEAIMSKAFHGEQDVSKKVRAIFMDASAALRRRKFSRCVGVIMGSGLHLPDDVLMMLMMKICELKRSLSGGSNVKQDTNNAFPWTKALSILSVGNYKVLNSECF